MLKGEWQVAAGYRWQRSDRHFRGIHEEPERQEEGSEVINNVHLIDITASYALSNRTTITLSVPVMEAERSQALRDIDRNVIGRFSTHAGGLGDIALTARRWMFDPSKNLDGNLSLGVGFKLPTGKDAAEDTFESLTGPAVRTVDQSIQPGDGGYGFVLDAFGFKQIPWNLTLISSFTYLFNPKNLNGTPTFRSRPSESIMSVADQYLIRAGFATPISSKHGISLSLCGRMEGVPVTDVFGKSDGFRRPGYAIAMEPGIIFSVGRSNFSFYVPVALKRNRQQSVPDMADNTIGDAAFADYFILSAYSYRF